MIPPLTRRCEVEEFKQQHQTAHQRHQVGVSPAVCLAVQAGDEHRRRWRSPCGLRRFSDGGKATCNPLIAWGRRFAKKPCRQKANKSGATMSKEKPWMMDGEPYC